MVIRYRKFSSYHRYKICLGESYLHNTEEEDALQQRRLKIFIRENHLCNMIRYIILLKKNKNIIINKKTFFFLNQQKSYVLYKSTFISVTFKKISTIPVD